MHVKVMSSEVMETRLCVCVCVCVCVFLERWLGNPSKRDLELVGSGAGWTEVEAKWEVGVSLDKEGPGLNKSCYLPGSLSCG